MECILLQLPQFGSLSDKSAQINLHHLQHNLHSLHHLVNGREHLCLQELHISLLNQYLKLGKLKFWIGYLSSKKIALKLFGIPSGAWISTICFVSFASLWLEQLSKNLVALVRECFTNIGIFKLQIRLISSFLENCPFK